MQEQRPAITVPNFVWIVPVALCFFVFGAGIFFYHNQLPGMIDTILWWFKVFWWAGLVIFVAIILYRVYERWHDSRLKVQARVQAKHKTVKLDLQNQMLAAQVQMVQQLPMVMKYAMEAGHNIKVSSRGELEVQNYLSNVHTLGSGLGQQMLAEASDYLPDPYKMSDVLRDFTPSKDGILLAKGRELITVPIGEPLCHTTFTGNTDSGKTNNERFLAIQLLYLQQTLYWCDRNWQPFRVDKKQGVIYDYTPIERLLAMDPITDTPTAVKLLKYLYSIVEERRLERRKVQSANAIVPFKDIYLFFDELPAFAGEDRDIMLYIGRLLREARQYGVFFIGAAQDLLNTTLSNDNGAIRDNLLTNYYGGGDMTTARLVLNLAKGERINEDGLGVQGITYLRAKGARIERIKARTPWADNEATELLLSERIPFTERSELPRIVESEPNEIPNEYTEHSERIAGDLRTVYNAITELRETGEKVTARSVAEYTGFGKDKANSLINELIARGMIRTDRQTDKVPIYGSTFDRQTDRQEVEA